MIDFNSNSVFKLSPCAPDEIAGSVHQILLQDEQLVLAFKGPRDFVTFTTKRIIAVNVQGLTGKKRDFTSLPYSKIQAFSIETAGSFDRDAELEMYFSGLGKVRFEVKGQSDIQGVSRLIASYVL